MVKVTYRIYWQTLVILLQCWWLFNDFCPKKNFCKRAKLYNGFEMLISKFLYILNWTMLFELKRNNFYLSKICKFLYFDLYHLHRKVNGFYITSMIFKPIIIPIQSLKSYLNFSYSLTSNFFKVSFHFINFCLYN